MKDKILTFIDRTNGKSLYILAGIMSAISAIQTFLALGVLAALPYLFLILFITQLYHVVVGWKKANEGWHSANINSLNLLDLLDKQRDHVKTLETIIDGLLNDIDKLTKIKAGSK